MAYSPQVHWSEGMFLRPQHLQAAYHHTQSILQNELDHILPYGWGIRSLEISEADLENFVFAIANCQVRLRDGTVVAVPEEADIEPREFKNELDGAEGRLPVYIGTPRLREEANVVDPRGDSEDEGRRYRIVTLELRDENTGTNPQQIEVRRLNGRLFFGAEDTTGYEVIQIAQLERSARTANRTIVSQDFIPPTLAMKACPVIYNLCHDLHQRLIAQNRHLASLASRDKIAVGGQGPGGVETFFKMRVTSIYTVLLGQLLSMPSLHPYLIYLELCRLVGELAIFGSSREAPQVPIYNHDKLGGCFFPIIENIEGMLKHLEPEAFLMRRFDKVGDQFECTLDDEWLAKDASYFLAFETNLDEAKVLAHVQTLKVAAPADLEKLLTVRRESLKLEFVRRLPSKLPDREGIFYFRIDQSNEFWQGSSHWAGVRKGKAIGISGPIEPTIEHTLYVVFNA
ncbi:type VI secretion system baseplate subunit TssK [Thermodesulfobacteriota bacterium]